MGCQFKLILISWQVGGIFAMIWNYYHDPNNKRGGEDGGYRRCHPIVREDKGLLRSYIPPPVLILHRPEQQHCKIQRPVHRIWVIGRMTKK